MAPPQTSKRSQRTAKADMPAAESTSAATEVDPLRASANVAPRRDIIPIPVLVIVFVVVEILIIWLMMPKFVTNWTSFDVRRRQMNGDFASAIPGLQRLAEEHPTVATHHAELGNAYFNLKQYDKSIEAYKKAQEYRSNAQPDEQGNMPDIPDFNNTIGRAYMQLNDLDNAEKHLKLALEHNKLDPAANFAMGELLFKRGKFKESGEYFQVVAPMPAYKKAVQDYYAKIEGELFAKIK